MHCVLILEFNRQKFQNDGPLQPVKLNFKEEENPSDCKYMVYDFIYFPIPPPILDHPKNSRLHQVYIC